jgi:beta-galactosidase
VRRRDALKAGGALTAAALLPCDAWAGTAAALHATPAPGEPGDEPVALIPLERGALLLDQAWRFHRGDIAPPRLLTHRASFDSVKAGNAIGAAATSYDDGDWPLVDLPHDWAIEAPPVRTENLAQGYRARGIAWYRRSFKLDAALRGRYLELQFGAIATHATIWFNGNEVAHNWSGYNSIYIDITTLASFGEALNTVAVRVDAETIEGWWYEGAGIYRHVWLIERSPVHIITDGVHADPRQRPDGSWHLPVEATLYSIESTSGAVRVTAELLDAQDRVLATESTAATIDALTRSVARVDLAGFAPQLWSVDEPNLYRVRTRVERDGRAIDERSTSCGFRTLRFDATEGFFLNGRHLKIRGACIHQDHAGVGVAVPDALVHWRVRQLKAMGCNAIRSSHNASGTALLDACDRLGMLVMAENRLFNVSPDYVMQLVWLVRRDRNRPSVMLWSVFNEEPVQALPTGYEMVRRLVAAVKALDDSRPVTAAMSGGMFTPLNVSQAVDVVGFNYQQNSYDRFHQLYPSQPLISSEDNSGFITRGAWALDKALHIEPSDDTQHAVWGDSHRSSWKAIETRPFIAGGFLWAGLDYHGEPTPFDWPSNSSYFGALDLCGFPKSAFHIRRALWIQDRPVLQILPHWNWPAGASVNVMVASNLEHVQLLLNGRLVGEGAVDRYDMITFTVPFAPGRLEARGRRDGKMLATHAVETTGAPARLRLTPSRRRLLGDGADAVPVTIEALDARGRPVPTANLRVALEVQNGALIGVGNGDPTSLASGKEREVALFNGLAQAIVQSQRGGHGALVLSAASSGLGAGRLELTLVPTTIAAIAPGPLRYAVTGWRQSPLLSLQPDASIAPADNDMNSWSAISPGVAPPFSPAAGYLALVATFVVPAALRESGGMLSLQTVNGTGRLWINGAAAADKTATESGPLHVTVPAGAPELRLVLVLRALPTERTGLPGLVFVESR